MNCTVSPHNNLGVGAQGVSINKKNLEELIMQENECIKCGEKESTTQEKNRLHICKGCAGKHAAEEHADFERESVYGEPDCEDGNYPMPEETD